MSLDILFTASTYRSVEHARTMANSIGRIRGRCELVLCGPIRSEIEDLSSMSEFASLVSPINNSYACRAIAALYAMREGMEPAYLCSCDDDLEFTAESADLLGELDRAQLETGFGVATFNSSSHNYEDMPGQIQERVGDTLEMGWLDGNSLFIPWDVVLDAGLPDSLPTAPLTYFTEVEYQHRVRVLLKRPSVAMIASWPFLRFLDFGAGSGKYGRMIKAVKPGAVVSAVEVEPDYVEQFNLRSIYDHVFQEWAQGFRSE